MRHANVDLGDALFDLPGELLPPEMAELELLLPLHVSCLAHSVPLRARSLLMSAHLVYASTHFHAHHPLIRARD